MTIVRKIIAVAAVAGALSVLPISGISSNYAGGVVIGPTGGATTNGQGNWPLKN